MKKSNCRSHKQEIRSDISWLAFIVVGWCLLLAPGNIDGTTNPVVSPLTIETAKPYDAQWTEFSGYSEKFRQCSFRRVDWYLGTRDKPNVPVPVVMSEPAIRMIGKIPVEEWRAKIEPVDRLLTDTFADVYHQCQFGGVDFPWLTKTRFWN